MKKILITGGAGGLGLATAKLFVEQGWTVYAADYNKKALDAINDKNIIPIHVDISQEESVAQAFAEVSKTTDSLDGIVNFAGIMVMGSVIECDVEMMRRILDINVLGMYRVNKAFLSMIQKGKGRIVNVSSEYGTLGAGPFNGFYTTSKHAVEMYSDALRRELLFLGIPVIKIRPGAFSTNMVAGTTDVFNKTVEDSKLFKEVLVQMQVLMEKNTGAAKDPAILAKVVLKAMTDKKPKLHYSANRSKPQQFLSSLPEKWQDAIYFKMMK